MGKLLRIVTVFGIYITIGIYNEQLFMAITGIGICLLAGAVAMSGLE